MRRNETVGYKIRLIHNKTHKIMEAKRTENENDLALTGMQCWTLGFLRDHENVAVYQRDIEAEFKVSRATASNMLAVMERKGLLERISVEHDARLKQLVLTAQGKRFMERAKSDMQEMEEVLLAGFSEQEKVQFQEMLSRVIANLGVDMEMPTRCCSEHSEDNK